MGNAGSISHALDGRKSGDGYRVQSVCHGGTDRNLFLSDGADGRLIAKCYSHVCSYKTIMTTLEDMGLKPKSQLDGRQRERFIQKKTRRQLMESLFFESHILLQYLNDRAGDIAKAGDRNYLKRHPEFIPMSDEPFQREMEAALRTKKIIGLLYEI